MRISVVVPTLNSIESLKDCVLSLKRQSVKASIIVVANGTTDGTQRWLANEHPDIHVLSYMKPLGFAGAVNRGIEEAFRQKSDYVALVNNDAVLDKNWLKELIPALDENKNIGIVTGKILRTGGKVIDSTGDFYTTWFLPYPRGRDEKNSTKYGLSEEVLCASGGASIYRIAMLKEIGLFDEDFFAYYEDVDISLRARHYGWSILYVPTALTEHIVGGTSSRIKGFTTLQTMKNLPLLYIKNVPWQLIVKYQWKFNIAYSLFFLRSIQRGHLLYSLRGYSGMLFLLPKKLRERNLIQKNSRLGWRGFDSLLVHNLPPNARALRPISRMLGEKS
jgi:hypothetical protein